LDPLDFFLDAFLAGVFVFDFFSFLPIDFLGGAGFLTTFFFGDVARLPTLFLALPLVATTAASDSTGDEGCSCELMVSLV
jgi:hypothetical protein